MHSHNPMHSQNVMRSQNPMHSHNVMRSQNPMHSHNPMHSSNVMRSQKGVTLLELLIAVSLVAILSTGMLFAMRTSVLAYQKTAQRLESNRRVVGIERILAGQLGGAMAVAQLCPAPEGPPVTTSFLSGNSAMLRLVSSFSIAEGARGYPRIVEYRVLAAAGGGVRLVASEQAYTGPQSTTPYCTGPLSDDLQPAALPPPPAGSSSYVLADRLAYCRISYHQPYDVNTFLETGWVSFWNRPVLPASLRFEMRASAPVAGGLPQLDITVPIRVTRDPLTAYEDQL